MRAPFATSGTTSNISVAATTASVSLGNPDQVRVMNNGTATVWIKFGASGVTATVNDMPLASGATEVFTLPALSGVAFAAVIAAGATGIVYFSSGNGI